MADWDLLLTDARIATLADGEGDYGVIEDGALAVRRGRIAWVGRAGDLPGGPGAAHRVALGGRWLTPALIDCHTHLVFAGNRAGEFEQRLGGATYADIAAAGGGILATVRATRAASVDTLVRASTPRLAALAAEGVATVEIKSGYGLDHATEIRMLEAARRLGREAGVTVSTSFLGAHTVPPEFEGRRTDYVTFLSEDVLPDVAARGLADAVDAYLEHLAFDPDDIRRLFGRARELGLPVRLHADQLSDSGGAALAAEFGALSADHIEYSAPEGIAAMGRAGTVAVLLPGAYVTLRETRRPPVDALRRAGVPMAVATDCNPGTSPLASLRTAMSLAASVFGLTPAECLAGVTREAARALGMAGERGTLEAGKAADLAAWDIEHPAELTYWMGMNPLADLYVAGVRRRTPA